MPPMSAMVCPTRMATIPVFCRNHDWTASTIASGQRDQWVDIERAACLGAFDARVDPALLLRRERHVELELGGRTAPGCRARCLVGRGYQQIDRTIMGK